MVLPKCPQHNCHPDDCFNLHYPESTREGGAPTEEEVRHTILMEHIRKQNENILKYAEEHERKVIDAEERFRQKGA